MGRTWRRGSRPEQLLRRLLNGHIIVLVPGEGDDRVSLLPRTKDMAFSILTYTVSLLLLSVHFTQLDMA